MEALVKILIIFSGVMLAVAYSVLLERKIAGWIQDRLGPNRVGPKGLFQPIADGLKLFFKEEIIPNHVNKVVYVLAPTIVMVTALVTFCVVPFGYVLPVAGQIRQMVIAPNVDIGIVFVFAVGSAAVYGVLLAGWASNNKFSFYGGVRAAAQMLSYEIPLGMSVLGMILLCGSLRIEDMVLLQATRGWGILLQPIGFLIFLVCAFAECNRLPFDMVECEQELVAGFHTEYSSMKFGFFFLAEYAHVITVSFLIVLLFFGGWHFPWIAPLVVSTDSIGLGGGLLRIGVLVAKVVLMVVVFMWVRWTLPRFRFDQILGLAWKVLVPLAILNVVIALVGVFFGFPGWAHLLAGVGGLALALAYAAWTAEAPESGEPSLKLRETP